MQVHVLQPQHRLAVWLSLCLALIMALAPTISRALMEGTSDGADDYFVCSGPGAPKFVSNEVRSQSEMPAPDHTTLSHCLFCICGEGNLGLPVESVALPDFKATHTQPRSARLAWFADR